MSIKACIKVPLILLENLIFSALPSLRPFVERHFFNPLNFKSDHIEYSRKKFDEFINLTGKYIMPKNSTLLELGPGGSIGFGLLALKQRAKKYIAIDDGTHTFIEKKQLRLYEKLLRSDHGSLKRYFRKQDKKIIYNPDYISFASIDQNSRYPLPDNSVDIIYSCAVLEHVHNLDLCFSEMSRVLKNNGIMYHEIDLRDHIFSQKSIWFLTINDYWFRALFSCTGGYVNRKRLSYYRSIAKKYHLNILFLDIPIRYMRNALPKELQIIYSEEDLRALSIKMILQKKPC